VRDVKVDIWVRELVRLISDMTHLHDDLAGQMRDKLDAIRQADSDRIEAITARESKLAGRLAEREGLRRQLTRRIVNGLGLDGQVDETIRLTALAEYLDEPRRSQLLVSAMGLKEKAEHIERLVATTKQVTEAMLEHMQEIFTVMTSGGPTNGGYSRVGRRENAKAASVFEAVG